jgi:formamidopyrimidine-DNA glycosylase
LHSFLTVVEAQCNSGRRGAVPVAKFLMDQTKTAGIGNYLLSEVWNPLAEGTV